MGEKAKKAGEADIWLVQCGGGGHMVQNIEGSCTADLTSR